jgi:hypothetical protein
MEDPLAVEREELLSMIEELEWLYAGLRDDVAGVSDSRMIELKQLRRRVMRARSPTKLKSAWEAAEKLLRAVAVEVIKLLFETFNCTITAINSRRSSYEDRGINQIPAWRRWAHAA